MNPLMMMIQMAQRGRNPLGALQQMGAGPQLQQMQQMLAGKNYNQLLQMADNAARERGFADTNYNLATQSCDIRNTIQSTARDVIDNANANTRSILDFMVNDKISTLQQENQTLRLAASQSEQNAVLKAAMDANTAELIRRTGNSTPQPTYLVQNPHAAYCGAGCQQGYGCC
jgi:hypothetical protein